MSASTVNAIHAVWLDPFSPLSDDERVHLEEAGITLEHVSTLGDMHIALRRAHVMVVRLGDSADLLQEVQTLIAQLGHNVPVLCRVERRRMELVVEAMRLGALHVVAADEWGTDAWRHALSSLRNQPTQHRQYVFVDPTSQHLLALAQRVAQADVTALLVGPTGAGKEVLARVLHESSARAKGPFVAMNCAALPEHLIEDMLFGHEKGAFTGAVKDHKGLFEQAQGGTVFLDEIGEMPMHLQAKLLRVLQEKKINRLGSEQTISVDVRVIAATNKDLRRAIEDREFREDLYFRISTFRLRILPLNQRPGDIMPLVMQSLARHAQGAAPYVVSEQAQEMLLQYPWPGNVRELENVVQRAVVLCNSRTITPAQLMFDESATPHGYEASTPSVSATTTTTAAETVHPSSLEAEAFAPRPAPVLEDGIESDSAINLQHAVKSSEHQIIMAALQSTESREAAARKLGISPRTLRYKLAQLRERGMGLSYV